MRPLTDADLESRLFIGTNAAFVVAGSALAANGNAGLGVLLDLASVGSVGYHWSQCALGGTNRPLVQLAMLVDYAFALPSAALGTVCALSLGSELPMSVVACAVAALASLAGGWLDVAEENPRVYMLFHGLWHIFSAAAGYQLALAM